MNALLGVIMVWLSANFEVPATTELPVVQFTNSPAAMLSADHAHYAQYGNMRHGIEVIAVYHGDSQTIFIGSRWQRDPVAASSILVHEMVHHMQHRSRSHYPCPGAREVLAFEAQDAWLKLFGRSLESEFGMDPFTVKAMTLCMH